MKTNSRWRVVGNQIIDTRLELKPRKATFIFVRRATIAEGWTFKKPLAIFRCKQNGQLVGRKYRSSDQ